jgi:D-amino-acid dehydrogenase
MAGHDAIVVGGGVVGAATAYHLVSAGVRTLLVDRGDAGRATDAGAGILSTSSALDHPDPVERFAALAAHDYPTLIERLAADAGGDTGHGECGTLTVTTGADERSSFAQIRGRRRLRPELTDIARRTGVAALAPALSATRRR